MGKEKIFKDRQEAGRELGQALLKKGYGGEKALVLGIPRGGVVVAAEVSETLSAPLDVIIARKLRAPFQPELGIGAVVDGDHIIILNDDLVSTVGATKEYLDREIAHQQEEIDRRLQLYRGDRPSPEISGKTAIVIDDGIATGYAFRAALEGLRRRHPLRLVAAAPVSAQDSARMLQAYADEVVCLEIPEFFMAVGSWYQNFDQTSDEEVAAILRHNWSRHKSSHRPDATAYA